MVEDEAVKRWNQGHVVHGNKELSEKLGRNDLCPCGSGRRFQTLLSRQRRYDGVLRDYYF